MEGYDGLVEMVILEPSRALASVNFDADVALTIVALISEDPSNWEEAASVWDRYRTEVVPEFVSQLSFSITEHQQALESLKSITNWVVIDFPNRRLFTGTDIPSIGRSAAYAMAEDEEGNQIAPLSVYIPPWWEFHENTTLDAVQQPRQTPIQRPHVDRDVLFGEPLLKDLADRVLAVVESESWKKSNAENLSEKCYPFTVQVHRDWLMTPRDDLNGRTPRQLLHGALSWTGQVTWGQQLRATHGHKLIALPNDWPDYEFAAMGLEEMCIYFDLCRELICEAWDWCSGDTGMEARQSQNNPAEKLVAFLRQIKSDWLNGSFEEGSSPNFIIECDRRRVPRGANLSIQGIDGVEPVDHQEECDCPICMMMGSLEFGPCFTGIDGHHLELDGEFAFSTYETYREWAENQGEFYQLNDEQALDTDQEVDRQTRSNSGESNAQADEELVEDLFGSAWAGMLSDEPIPGDPEGLLKMAFMVAEIVMELKLLNAPQEEVKQLNQMFTHYRTSDVPDRPEAAALFVHFLEFLSENYPPLISKSADLQSRIVEGERELR